MPARNSSMELSSPSHSDADTSLQPSRRKSGRIVKKPDHLSPSFNDGRKAEMNHDEIDDEDEDMSQDSDDHETPERKRKAKHPPAKTTKTKRPKVDGAALTIRSAPKAKKARSNIRKSDAIDDSSLYGEVFGDNKPFDAITLEWLERFQQHESAALAELVNFVLRCSGCTAEIDAHNVEDPDSATSKLVDLQDEYQSSDIVDYPLIRKAKIAATTRAGLLGFLSTLIQTIALAEDSMIYQDGNAFIENVQVWVSSMSSAANRPFRHTATVAAIAIMQGLCQVAKIISDQNATTLKQLKGEKTKTKANAARARDLDQQSKVQAQQLKTVNTILRDWFDTVIVHRYRDVDPHIRTDCMTAILDWCLVYPDHFLNGEHLRYVGWLLVDTHVQCRLEILKGLKKLYKDDGRVAIMGAFTARFYRRYIEMALSDADISVRVNSIDLLELFRDKGLLEPDDLDSIGQMIYDSEPRVRSAITPFFLAIINETFEAKQQELGSEEEIEEDLPAPDAEDFDALRIDWLGYKALAELMKIYDEDEERQHTEERHRPHSFEEAMNASRSGSKFAVAATGLIEKLDMLQNWETLAGYLLYDHSSGAIPRGDSMEHRLKKACQIDDKEEIILLEVLNTSVQHALTQVTLETRSKKTKMTKAQQREIEESAQAATQRLASLIPRLLNKFSASSKTVASVLRLARVLNLDVFEDLRQDSSVFSKLLDDINLQFSTHDSEAVQAEARAAILHASSFADLQEVTDAKIQSLWDETAYAFSALAANDALSKRGAKSIDTTYLTGLSNSVARLAGLAQIADPSTAFEKPQVIGGKQKKRQSQPASTTPTPLINNLLSILKRGVPTSAVSLTSEQLELEARLTAHTCQACLFYFMWQANTLSEDIASISPARLAILTERYDTCISNLGTIVQKTKGADVTRLSAAGALLDLETIMAKFHKPSPSGNETSEIERKRADLADKLNPLTQDHVRSLFTALDAFERDFATKADKKVEDAGVDDEPEDLTDAEPEDDEDDEEQMDSEGSTGIAERKAKAVLLAEERLCSLAGKLVLALLAGVFAGVKGGEGPVRTRVLRNKNKLGSNFKALCGVLEKEEAERSGKNVTRRAAAAIGGSKSVAKAGSKGKQTTKSKEFVDDDEEDDEDDQEENDKPEEMDQADLRRQGLDDGDEELEDAEQDAGRGAEESNDEGSLLGD